MFRWDTAELLWPFASIIFYTFLLSLSHSHFRGRSHLYLLAVYTVDFFGVCCLSYLLSLFDVALYIFQYVCSFNSDDSCLLFVVFVFCFIFRCARIFSFEHSSCVSEWTADGLVWQKVNVCSIIIEYVELQSAEHWCSGFNSFLFVFISANIQRKFL